jgi:hypothetical protein
MPVLLATFADMGGKDLEERAMRHETGWGHEPRDLFLAQQWQETLNAYRNRWRIDVYDPAEMGVSHDIETFQVWLERKMSKVRYRCIFVDYAQELTSRDRKVRDDLSQASACASLLQRLARKLDVPVVVGSQITEGQNGRKDMTKGSRVWEEKAGLVLRIKREKGSSVADVKVAWNRFGPEGGVTLRWDDERVRFYDPDSPSTPVPSSGEYDPFEDE